jgi:tetratricopeptide (TPR) repeat protein
MDRIKLLALYFVATCLILAARVSATPAPQQSDSKADLPTEAAKAYDAKDWPKAAQLYEQITAEKPQVGRAWYRLGTSLHSLGNQEKAIAAFQKALDNGAAPPFCEYGMAASYASLKNKEKALDFLEKSAQHGFGNLDQLRDDKEWGAFRDDARFAKALEQTKHNQKPCAYASVNREFDFWLGEWNVVTADATTPAGTSKIELILGDCVIQENWTSTNIGYSGKSYNIYNPDLKRWEQFWVDNTGGTIRFYGELKDGVMDYWTDEIPQPDGTKLKRHLQFIPQGPDTVRQFSRGSADGGKTWTVEYDFIYHRKK